MTHVEHRRLVPALLALVLSTCSGCHANACLPGEIAIRYSREVPEVASHIARIKVNAVTIGRTVFVHPDAAGDSALIRHELEHVAQWDRGGLVFALDYAWQWARHGYWSNPYELAADSASLVVAHGANR